MSAESQGKIKKSSITLKKKKHSKKMSIQSGSKEMEIYYLNDREFL